MRAMDFGRDRKIWLEDLPLGTQIDCGTFSVSEAEIVAFAGQYDPQPFHVDPDRARHGEFGGLIASSTQTIAISCGLMVRAMRRVQFLCGLAWENIALLRPIRPRRTYAVTARWASARPSASRPDRGIARVAVEVLDERRVAASYVIAYFVRRRPTG